MPKSSNTRFTLYLVVFTVIVDMIGFGAAFPVIPILFSPETSYFGDLISEENLELYYGIVIAIFAVFQFISAPALGALSDRYGRKRMLLFSIMGTLIGILIFAIGILKKDFTLLLVGRSIQGLAGGNIAICYSIIADVSTKKNKVKNFGLVGVAFGIGMLVGAAIGGFLSEPSIQPWFNLALPFWFVCILAFVNLMLVYWRLPETNHDRTHHKITPWMGVGNVMKGFRHPRLKSVFGVILINAFAFAFFTHLIPLFAIAKFGWTQMTLSLFLLYTGVWGVIAQAVFIQLFAKYFRVATTVIVASVLVLIGYCLLLVPDDDTYLLFCIPVLAIGHGVYLSNVTALVSNLGDTAIQGQILGINQSLHSISNIFPPIVGGVLISQSISLPIYAAIACSIVGSLMFTLWYLKSKKQGKAVN